MSATASTTAKPQESTAVRILKKPITATLLAIVLGFAVAAILLAVAGYDPIASFTALFEGIFSKPKYISNTIINTLGNVSGIVCDGAKASCAAKIAESVDAAILGYNMYVKGQQFYGGDGIVKKGVENTIQNVGRLAKDGMKKTNEEIISIMIEC